MGSIAWMSIVMLYKRVVEWEYGFLCVSTCNGGETEQVVNGSHTVEKNVVVLRTNMQYWWSGLVKNTHAQDKGLGS